VGSETDEYRLSVSGYSGDIGDALAAHVNPYKRNNGMPFTTPDQDNDPTESVNCGGGISGWWFNKCTRSNVNRDSNGMWNAFSNDMIVDVQLAHMLVKFD